MGIGALATESFFDETQHTAFRPALHPPSFAAQGFVTAKPEPQHLLLTNS